jgi:hypothetical protein
MKSSKLLKIGVLTGIIASQTCMAALSAEAEQPAAAAPASTCINYSINIKPQSVAILEETPFYDSYDNPGKPAGILSAMQGLTVKEVDREWNTPCSPNPKWYLVETWLGDKWIRAGEGVMNGAKYTADSTMITSAYEVALYDRPDAGSNTELSLSPQKLSSTGSIRFQRMQGHNALSFISGNGIWYRIETWLGEKWILSPAILEDVKEIALDDNMRLTGAETGYPLPYMQEGKEEELPAGVVKALAKWDTTSSMGPWGMTSYKIQLPNGEIRWFQPKNEVIHNYRPMDEELALLTETRYFDKPLTDYVINWLEPGSYKAFEASGDWVHIHTPHGDKWVNPARAHLERPVGIQKTNVYITLDQETEYTQFPIIGATAQPKGFYAPQKVQAFEKWEAPDGDVWYQFHGLSDAWVRNPKLAE